MTRFLYVFILIFPACVFAHDDFPADEDILKFLSKTTDVKVEIYTKDKSKISTIYLKNHEKAYLLPVALSNSGRNSFFQTVLVRPTIQEAKILEGTIIKSVDEIYDLDNDKVYELVVSEIYSGQGTEGGRKAIVQINGWNPVVLYERPLITNEGEYGVKDVRYYSEQYFWEFEDLNADGILDLKETSSISTGRDKLPPIIKREVSEYIYSKNKFVRRESNEK